ncbi:MAG: acyltransferase [Candidatus Eisenbacteria bacterium]|nr:acyltransferase [Candidatus Eisenbacteria bacterium]
MKEIRALTTLRALAALLVFLYHYQALYVEEARAAGRTLWDPFLPIWRSGAVGVSIFFVLSGFLITRLYYDRFAAGAVTLREYFVKRVARIGPLFLAFAVLQHLGMIFFGERPQASWLVTLSMTQGFFWDLRYRGLPTAWSLTIEESFYAVAPLLFAAIAGLALRRAPPSARLSRRDGIALLSVLAAATLVLAGAGALVLAVVTAKHWTPFGFMADPEHVLHATLAGRFPEFAIGMTCAFLHRDGWPERALAGHRATRAALGAFAGIVALMAVKDAAARADAMLAGLASSLGIAMLAGLLILALTREDQPVARALSHPLGVALGKVSYGFYLIQTSLLAAPFVGLAEKLGPLRLPAEYVFLNLVCAFFYARLERPLRSEIVRRWSGGRLGDAAR